MAGCLLWEAQAPQSRSPAFPSPGSALASHSVGSEQALAEPMDVQQVHMGRRHKTSPHVTFSDSQQALEVQATWKEQRPNSPLDGRELAACKARSGCNEGSRFTPLLGHLERRGSTHSLAALSTSVLLSSQALGLVCN